MTRCISCPGNGPWKCEVYWVMSRPSALRDSSRMNSGRSLWRGITFSIPMVATYSGGRVALMSALPSLVHTTMPPVSAIPKLTPVMPASALT